MVKKYMFYIGQRPKYARTKVGAFAQQSADSNINPKTSLPQSRIYAF
jgi:hypothetical protein